MKNIEKIREVRDRGCVVYINNNNKDKEIVKERDFQYFASIYFRAANRKLRRDDVYYLDMLSSYIYNCYNKHGCVYLSYMQYSRFIHIHDRLFPQILV